MKQKSKFFRQDIFLENSQLFGIWKKIVPAPPHIIGSENILIHK